MLRSAATHRELRMRNGSYPRKDILGKILKNDWAISVYNKLHPLLNPFDTLVCYLIMVL